MFLTGFMATGKSQVGRLLADRMGCTFVDTDAMIEKRVGSAISDIFATRGEDVFRDLEHECVSEVARRCDVVVALGGGALMEERNRDAICSGGGTLVCLDADPDTILKRVGRNQTRPLLAGLSPDEMRDKVMRMLRERAPFYEAADLMVKSTCEQTPQDTAEEIQRFLQQRGQCKQ